MPQIKAHFFNPKDSILIMGYSEMLNRGWNTNNIHEEASMWDLFFCVKKPFANALNSRVSVVDRFLSFPNSVRNKEVRSHKLLYSYPELGNQLLKMYTTDVWSLRTTPHFYVTSSHSTWLINNTPTIWLQNLVKFPTYMTRALRVP